LLALSAVRTSTVDVRLVAVHLGIRALRRKAARARRIAQTRRAVRVATARGAIDAGCAEPPPAVDVCLIGAEHAVGARLGQAKPKLLVAEPTETVSLDQALASVAAGSACSAAAVHVGLVLTDYAVGAAAWKTKLSNWAARLGGAVGAVGAAKTFLTTSARPSTVDISFLATQYAIRTGRRDTDTIFDVARSAGAVPVLVAISADGTPNTLRASAVDVGLIPVQLFVGAAQRHAE
jgi:hypothetical protein